MYKIEIVANKSVEEDIVEALESVMPKLLYTIIPEALGRGKNNRKLGNTTWPEMNFVLFAYTDYGQMRCARELLEAIKGKYPDEGIKYFYSELSDR